MPTIHYEEEWEYKWVKSKARLAECEAYDSLADFPDAIYFKNGHYLYAIAEKQLYRSKHVRKLKYVKTEWEQE